MTHQIRVFGGLIEGSRGQTTFMKTEWRRHSPDDVDDVGSTSKYADPDYKACGARVHACNADTEAVTAFGTFLYTTVFAIATEPSALTS